MPAAPSAAGCGNGADVAARPVLVSLPSGSGVVPARTWRPTASADRTTGPAAVATSGGVGIRSAGVAIPSTGAGAGSSVGCPAAMAEGGEAEGTAMRVAAPTVPPTSAAETAERATRGVSIEGSIAGGTTAMSVFPFSSRASTAGATPERTVVTSA